MSITRRLAQGALGAPFIWLGYQAASSPGARVTAAERLGVPAPEAAVRFNGAAMVAGGVALCANVLPRVAATGLLAALVPTTIAGHAFWKMEPDDPARGIQKIQALKNLALIGGLGLVASGA